jgi:hypothetical protein
MTERNEPGDEDERRRAEEDERRTSEEGARRPRRRRERREESGDDPLRHARILQHRWEGSPRPTAERYARALQQWRALPGAVVSPGTSTTAGPERTGPDERNQS